MKSKLPEQVYDEYCPGNELNLNREHYFWDRPSRLGIPVYAEGGITARRRGSVLFMHHRYPYLAVEMVVYGSLLYLFDGEKIRGETNDVFLLHHNKDSGFRNNSTGYYEKRVLILTGSMCDALVENIGLGNVKRIHPSDPDGIRKRMEAILLLLKEKKEGTEFEIASKSCDLLFTLAAECQKNAFPGPENLRRTLTCIESQLYLPLSVDNMAAFCKVSPATLARLFRKYLQCTPMEYLLQKRMKHARDLLRTTELSIKEISVRCGIPDQLYFSTVFKKNCGESPREYRKK